MAVVVIGESLNATIPAICDAVKHTTLHTFKKLHWNKLKPIPIIWISMRK